MFRHSTLLAFIAVLMLAISSPVHAEGGVSIAVVDMQQILSESDAAKSILAQLKTHREAMEKEIKSLEDSLKKDEQALVKKREGMKPEEFAKDRKAFETKLLESRSKVQKERASADAAFNKAINELRKNLVDVVSTLATEKKIQLVITKQNVIIGDSALEITAEVMKRLNAKIKTIKVSVSK